VLFHQGRIVAQGETRSVLTKEQLDRVFGLDCRLISVNDLEMPIIVPLSAAGK